MDLNEIESEKYISLETYKKNNQAVRTPVWFVVKNNRIYVVTRDQTSKIKRLRNNQKIKIATCNIKGKISSQFTEGIAEILSDTESRQVVDWRDEKYGIFSKIAKFLSKNKGQLVAISIKID